MNKIQINNSQIKSIKGYGAFPLVFKFGKKFHSSDCTAFFIKKFPDDAKVPIKVKIEPGVVFYGVSVGKRSVKRAVDRNRIKRLIRESLRQTLRSRKDINFGLILINWRSPVNNAKLIGLKNVLPQIEKMFDSANRYYSETDKAPKT